MEQDVRPVDEDNINVAVSKSFLLADGGWNLLPTL